MLNSPSIDLGLFFCLGSIYQELKQSYNQLLTPPCLEHVPLVLWLKDQVPSLHLAVAPLGFVLDFLGLGT